MNSRPNTNNKDKPVAKKECEVKVKTHCNNQGVCRLQGKLDTDPKFYCCMGCRCWFSRNKIKVREVPDGRK